jgi:hypothetical protein
LVAVELLVLDAQGSVVARVRSYTSAGVLSSFTLSSETFVPEKQRVLTVLDSQGNASAYSGAGLDGSGLPSGYYLMRLEQPGQGAIEKAFWIQHEDYGEGKLLVLGATAGGSARIGFWFGENVELQARVYNLAGELVSLGSAAGSSGVLSVDMQSSGGKNVSPGIYLVLLRGKMANGGVEFSRVLKMAVLK